MAEAIRQLPPPSDFELKFPKLGRFRYQRLLRAAKGEGKSPPSKDERIDALRSIGDSGDRRAVSDILGIAADESEPLKIREAALVAAGALGDSQIVAILVEFLDAPNSELRSGAVSGLGRLRDRRAVRALMQFGIEHPSSKFLSYDALLRMGEKATLELLDVLNSSDPGIVLEGVVLLGRLKDARATPVLIQVIETRSAVFRSHAAESLGEIGDRKASRALISLLTDENAAVRVNAAAALARVIDPNAVEPLIACLNDGDEDVRLQAIQTLGAIGDRRAATALCRRLDDESADVQIAAADALGQCGDARAVPRLLERVQHSDERIQLKAISALRRLKDPRTVAALLPLLEHASDAIRQRSIDTLGQIGDAEVAARLEEKLKRDRSEIVRAAAAKALGDIGDPGSLDALLDALSDDFAVRCRAVVALGQLRDDLALPAIAALLRDPVPEIRYHAVGSLVELGPRNATTLLEPLIEDSNVMVRRGVLKALQKLGDSRAEELAAREVDQSLRARIRLARKQIVRGVLKAIPGPVAQVIFPGTRRAAATMAASALGIVLAIGLGVALWGGKSAPVVKTKRGKVQSLAINSDGGALVVARNDGTVEYWEIASGTWKGSARHSAASDIKAVPGGSLVVIPEGTAPVLWNVLQEKTPATKLEGHQKAVIATSVSPDGKFLATLDAANVVVRWNLPGGTQSAAIQLPPGATSKVLALFAEGRFLATSDSAGMVHLWDLEKAVLVQSFKRPEAEIFASALAPDGSLLAISSSKGLELLPLGRGTKLFEPPLLPSPPTRLQFSDDGQRLAALIGNDIVLVEMATGAMKSISVADSDGLTTMALSADGSLVAAGGEENLQVWLMETATGRERGVLGNP